MNLAIDRAFRAACRTVLLASMLLVFAPYAPALHAQERAIEPVAKGLVYSKAGDTELKLDLAQPSGSGPFPAIVFIHGGGWYLGNRENYSSLIAEAARRGYVGVTVTYRLMKFDETTKDTGVASPNFPAQVHDVKAAVRWLRANAQKYHVDPKRIGATGRSAGGHLSLMLGLTDRDARLEGDGGFLNESSRVQSVVNVYGPTDMVECYRTSTLSWLFRLFLGGTPEEAAGNYAQASPLTFVSADDPPVLTLQGDQDRAVPLANATKLDEAMKSAGARHTLVVLPGQGHGFGGAHRQEELAEMWAFFAEHLRP